MASSPPEVDIIEAILYTSSSSSSSSVNKTVEVIRKLFYPRSNFR